MGVDPKVPPFVQTAQKESSKAQHLQTHPYVPEIGANSVPFGRLGGGIRVNCRVPSEMVDPCHA